MRITLKHGDVRDVLLAIARELPDYEVSWAIARNRKDAAILIEAKEEK